MNCAVSKAGQLIADEDIRNFYSEPLSAQQTATLRNHVDKFKSLKKNVAKVDPGADKFILIRGKKYLIHKEVSVLKKYKIQKDYLIGKDYQEILIRFSHDPRRDERIIIQGKETLEFSRPISGIFTNIHITKKSKTGILASDYKFDRQSKSYFLLGSKFNGTLKYNMDALEVGDDQNLNSELNNYNNQYKVYFQGVARVDEQVTCRFKELDSLIFDSSCSDSKWSESKDLMREGLVRIMNSSTQSHREDNLYLSCLEQHNLAPTAAKLKATLLGLEASAEALKKNDMVGDLGQWQYSHNPAYGGHDGEKACQPSAKLREDIKSSDEFLNEIGIRKRDDGSDKKMQKTKHFSSDPIVSCQENNQEPCNFGYTEPNNVTNFVMTQTWQNMRNYGGTDGSCQKPSPPLDPIKNREAIINSYGNTMFHELLHLQGITDEELGHNIDKCCGFEGSSRTEGCKYVDNFSIQMRVYNSNRNWCFTPPDGSAIASGSAPDHGVCGQIQDQVEQRVGKLGRQIIMDDFFNAISITDTGSGQVGIYNKSVAFFIKCMNDKRAPQTLPASAKGELSPDDQFDCYKRAETEVYQEGVKKWAQDECASIKKDDSKNRYPGLNCSEFPEMFSQLFKTRVDQDLAEVKKHVDTMKPGDALFTFLLQRTERLAAMDPDTPGTLYNSVGTEQSSVTTGSHAEDPSPSNRRIASHFGGELFALAKDPSDPASDPGARPVKEGVPSVVSGGGRESNPNTPQVAASAPVPPPVLPNPAPSTDPPTASPVPGFIPKNEGNGIRSSPNFNSVNPIPGPADPPLSPPNLKIGNAPLTPPPSIVDRSIVPPHQSPLLAPNSILNSGISATTLPAAINLDLREPLSPALAQIRLASSTESIREIISKWSVDQIREAFTDPNRIFFNTLESVARAKKLAIKILDATKIQIGKVGDKSCKIVDITEVASRTPASNLRPTKPLFRSCGEKE